MVAPDGPRARFDSSSAHESMSTEIVSRVGGVGQIQPDASSTYSAACAPSYDLSVRLSLCSHAELSAVGDLLGAFELQRGLGWVRHRGDHEWWHAIAEIACGSIATLCNGRMSVRAEFDLEARPSSADRCGRCQELYAQRALVMVGLRELRDATGEVAHEAFNADSPTVGGAKGKE